MYYVANMLTINMFKVNMLEISKIIVIIKKFIVNLFTIIANFIISL